MRMREDITAVLSAIVALAFVGVSIHMVSSLLVLERVVQSLIAVRLYVSPYKYKISELHS